MTKTAKIMVGTILLGISIGSLSGVKLYAALHQPVSDEGKRIAATKLVAEGAANACETAAAQISHGWSDYYTDSVKSLGNNRYTVDCRWYDGNYSKDKTTLIATDQGDIKSVHFTVIGVNGPIREHSW